ADRTGRNGCGKVGKPFIIAPVVPRCKREATPQNGTGSASDAEPLRNNRGNPVHEPTCGHTVGAGGLLQCHKASGSRTDSSGHTGRSARTIRSSPPAGGCVRRLVLGR